MLLARGMWRRPAALKLTAAAVNTCRILTRSSSSSTCATTLPFKIHGGLTQLARGELPSVGTEAYVTHTFSLTDTKGFASLSGDSNPIHTDAAFARAHANANAPVVQGMLSASLFATIFGASIPGAVYVSQNLRWRQPLLVDERVVARIRVVKLRKRFVDCETICVREFDNAVVVEGVATVLLPPAPAP